MQKRTALIVGGTTGLGMELALLFKKTHETYVTGRWDPRKDGVHYHCLELSDWTDQQRMDFMLERLPTIDLFVYAAGFYQKGRLSELSDKEIFEMNNVGLLAPILLIQRILKKQKSLGGLIAITSTSQWTPRLDEPVYTAVKSGLGMLAESFSYDESVGKVLVAAPAGMATGFWEGTDRDLSDMLNPAWVAKQIVRLYRGEFAYKLAAILRKPARVEVRETRLKT